MPGLKDLRRAEPLIQTRATWEADRVYPSPDGTMALRLSGNCEIRMGAPYWRTVQVEWPDGSKPPTELDPPEAIRTFVDPYVPWNVTSDRVAVPTLRFDDDAQPTFGCAIFDLPAGTMTEFPAAGWVSAAAWSPAEDKLLIGNEDGLRILSPDGPILAVPNTERRSAVFVVGWAPDGASFFCLRRSADGPVLRFFDTATGEQVSDVPLDPVELVPYNVLAYAGIDRGPYCLKIGSTWGAGTLLDNWSSADYDATRSTIRLAVYRPTSAVQVYPQPDGSELLGCEVRQLWVQATVVA